MVCDRDTGSGFGGLSPPSTVPISQMWQSHGDPWDEPSNQRAEVEKLNSVLAVSLFSSEVRWVIGALTKKKKKIKTGKERK